MSSNLRNKKRRGRVSDEQENAIAITESEFETDGVLTRSAAKKSRKNKTVTFAQVESSKDDSERDELESDEESSQQQDNNTDDSNHENQETQVQPNETPQQDSGDSNDEYQPNEAPQRQTISIDSSDDESQPEETPQQENGSDQGNQRYFGNESRENSVDYHGLNAIEVELIQVFQLKYPGDESYRVCLNRIKREAAPHRARKAREPWCSFETFAIEMRLTEHNDSQWVGIKKDCPHIFSNRTNVQIKDKARTELKRRLTANEPLGGFECLTN